MALFLFIYSSYQGPQSHPRHLPLEIKINYILAHHPTHGPPSHPSPFGECWKSLLFFGRSMQIWRTKNRILHFHRTYSSHIQRTRTRWVATWHWPQIKKPAILKIICVMSNGRFLFCSNECWWHQNTLMFLMETYDEITITSLMDAESYREGWKGVGG